LLCGIKIATVSASDAAIGLSINIRLPAFITGGPVPAVYARRLFSRSTHIDFFQEFSIELTISTPLLFYCPVKPSILFMLAGISLLPAVGYAAIPCTRSIHRLHRRR
jgi:hypothetical protein